MKFITTKSPFIQFSAEEGTIRFAANEINAFQKVFRWQWLSMYGIRWKDKYLMLDDSNE
jgi:hypothetical protein